MRFLVVLAMTGVVLIPFFQSSRIENVWVAKRRKVVWCRLNDDRWWGGGYFLATAAEPGTGISASAPNEELCITAAIFQINQTLRLCSVLWNSFCLFSSSCCCCCWCCCRCWKSDFRAENPHHIASGECLLPAGGSAQLRPAAPSPAVLYTTVQLYTRPAQYNITHYTLFLGLSVTVKLTNTK